MFLVRTHLDRECEGRVHPWYVGNAYRRPEIRATVEAIIPLNWVIAFTRRLWCALVYGLQPSRLERVLNDVYWTAHCEGFCQGAEMQRKIDEKHPCSCQLEKHNLHQGPVVILQPDEHCVLHGVQSAQYRALARLDG